MDPVKVCEAAEAAIDLIKEKIENNSLSIEDVEQIMNDPNFTVDQLRTAASFYKDVATYWQRTYYAQVCAGYL